MKNRTRFVTAKHLSFVLLVVILAALTPLFLKSDNATHAQAAVSAVSDAPALTVVSASSTAVELSWTLVADAVSYELLTWWDGAGDWQRIDDGSLTGRSDTHDGVTAERKHFYIVAGVDGNGRRGPWSARVEVTVPGSEAPTPTSTSTLSSALTPTPTPTLLLTPTPTQTNPTHTPSPTAAASALSAPTLQAEAGPGQITLSWGRFANADSYRLVVWDPAISDWVRIGGVLTGTSYTHSGLSAGTTYYFHILAVAAGRAVSDWSQQVSAVVSGTLSQTQTPTRIPLLSPTPTSVTAVTSTPTPTATAIALSAPSLQAEAGPSQITLTWGRVANADSYRLIFYDRAISDWVQIGGVLTGTSYTHGGLTAGTTNYYRILSVAAGGAVSNWSEHVSAVVSASTTPTSTVTATVTATPTATPTVTATPMVTVTPTLALTPTGTATRATTERGALVALYEATDGDNWTYSYNWLTEAPLSAWYDVETDDSGHVIFLAPTENNLRGSIPNLSALTELTWLGLGKNWLTGPIPELSAFSKLSVLNLNYNRLAGEIPDLGRLTKLMWLYLNDNDLTGEIPDLSALTNLTWLDLGYNRLTVPIPDLSNLRSLFGLVLRGNDLTGEIPDLSAHTDLEQLDLGGNDLTGEIPDLGALTNLEQLVLGGNDLTGEIPDLGDLTELTTLDLGGNDLTEGIPDLNTLTELTTLNLGSNDLSGEIPDLSALISLESLFLNHNQLTGPVLGLSTLTNLTHLDLSNNQLTGPIPELIVLSNLIQLDLSNNRLSGPVPDLNALTKLENLNLTGNQFCLLAGASLSHANSRVDAHLKSLSLDICTEAELAEIPGLPQNLTATVATGQVTLRWDGVANAATYDLWVWDSIDLQWGPIGGALADTTYTHSVPVEKREDRSYYFQVRARDTNGVPGPWSERVRTVLVPQQFSPPPLSLGLDIYYQKHIEVGGVHVVAPSAAPDSKMVQTREVITSMLSTRPDLLEAMADYGTRIFINPNVYGHAQQLPDVFEAYVPVEDLHCFTLIHEFSHVIHYTIGELSGGNQFNLRLQALYDAALEADLWDGDWALRNVREYWAQAVTYWFQESLDIPSVSGNLTLENYDPEAARLIEEVFGEATVPSYCKP